MRIKMQIWLLNKGRRRLYLAAAFERRHELRQMAKKLEAAGFMVVSDWIYEGDEGDKLSEKLHEPGRMTPQDRMNCCLIGHRDLEQIKKCDALLLVAGGAQRGGKHFEAGYAHGLGKPLYLIGPPEIVFHYTYFFKWFESVEEFIGARPGGFLVAGRKNG
ncbi:MAG: nucleoside 2-deoxyribosyltransferase [Deltaproteobacteria bacterium]|nr:nucleoside 2-deoxyribosyltransferase [Deltaproteobacteria bacterium]